MEKISLNWRNDMTFEANVDNHKIILDAAPEFGGNDNGPKPKPLILIALAGCTAMDVASLAKKMRVNFTNLNVEVEAQKSESLPVVYTQFNVIYHFQSQDDNAKDKLLKIVTGSQEKYCGVSAMLRQIGPVTYQVYLNGELIA